MQKLEPQMPITTAQTSKLEVDLVTRRPKHPLLKLYLRSFLPAITAIQYCVMNSKSAVTRAVYFGDDNLVIYLGSLFIAQ